MKRLILTVGAPGSGKSTWAKEFMKSTPGFVNLNRDDFRAALISFGKRPSKSQETQVTTAQFAAAADLIQLEHVKGIIISDTNLNPTTVLKWQAFAKANKVKFEEVLFDVNFQELKRRNQKRGKEAVPSDVLRMFFYKMQAKMGREPYFPDMSLPKAIIYDLDGTLAIHNGRSPYDLDKLSTDKPNTMVVEHLLAMQKAGYAIITASGRESGIESEPLRYRVSTLDWMREQGIVPELHIQRKQGDDRSDHVVKLEMFNEQIKDKYQVVLSVDDRDQVVDMWRSIGIPCWQVNYGDF